MRDYPTLSLVPVIALYRMCPEWTGPVPVLFIPFINATPRRFRDLQSTYWRVPRRAGSRKPGHLSFHRENS
jgi:hypothetical protein